MDTERALETAVSSYRERFETEDICDIPGVMKVILSPVTQREIGCVVGIHVTLRDPCIFVNKDQIDLQSETSEFLEMKQAILEYPDTNLLLVFDTATPVSDTEGFFVCVTKDAKDSMLAAIEKQKKELRERLRKFIEKTPRFWTSLGSEAEIDDTIPRNLRSLISTEVKTNWPVHDKKVKFSIKMATATDGDYVELLLGHIPISNVFRKRIDAATQATPVTNTNEAQTNPSFPRNTWTDYKLKNDDPICDAEKEKHPIEFADKIIENLTNKIDVNQNINFYSNDYDDLIKKPYSLQRLSGRESIHYQNVLFCQNKKVSAITWHPLITGVIAAAYAQSSSTEMSMKTELLDEARETIYNRNLILLWCETNNLQPKLYLRSHREITCLNFCPYNPNILVGGCSNGQIVIWDITNEISSKQSTNKVILTQAQQRHKTVMYSVMNWLKSIQDISIIDPTVVSSANFSHEASVTDIAWISRDYKLTEIRKIVSIDSDCNSKIINLQFFTCSSDCMLYLWDLSTPPQPSTSMQIKISSRIKKLPQALIKTQSRLYTLDKKLYPLHKFTITDARHKINQPLSNLTLLNRYDKITVPYTESSEFLDETQIDLSEFIPKFMVASQTGMVLQCSLSDGNEDDPNLIAEACKATVCVSAHDGPVRICQRNSFIPGIILTVGGKVFAIWDETDQGKVPFIWRKTKLRYLSGIWSTLEPHVIILFRSDSHFEIWDLLLRSKHPDYVVRYTGNMIVDGFGDSVARTYCTADIRGAIKLCNFPRIADKYNLEELKEETMKSFKKQTEIQQKLKQWTLSLRTKNTKEIALKKDNRHTFRPKTVTIEDERQEVRQIMKTLKFYNVDKQCSERWNKKQEKIMYKIILKKNKLNLKDLAAQNEPLLKIEENRIAQQEKQLNTILSKDQVYMKSRNFLLDRAVFPKRNTITPKHIMSQAKLSYMSSYKDIEKNALNFIGTNPLCLKFDWVNWITREKCRIPKKAIDLSESTIF